jgi:uncharacterized membrane protein YtjA (UPF0391 family)
MHVTGHKSLSVKVGITIAPLSAGGQKQMLYYTWIFLLLALIAGLFGFGIVASAAAGIAKILFFIFLVIFLITLITGRRPA